MIPISRSRSQPRASRSWSFSGMDYSDSRRKPHFLGKAFMVLILTGLCIFMLKQSPGFSGTSVFDLYGMYNEQSARFANVELVNNLVSGGERSRVICKSRTRTILDEMKLS